MDWVVQRHGILYNQMFGWDKRFEGLVAEIVAKFVRNFKPQRERCWIAEQDGEHIGSVFLIENDETVAQLRLLIVEPHTRGLGIGDRLVRECSRFAKQVGYNKIILWTDTQLQSALRIYARNGYQFVKTDNHESFGYHVEGQYWNSHCDLKHDGAPTCKLPTSSFPSITEPITKIDATHIRRSRLS